MSFAIFVMSLQISISKLISLSCQTHADGGWNCWSIDITSINQFLVALNIELQGSPVVANIDSDRSTHYKRQVYGTMTSRETAEYRDVVVF